MNSFAATIESIHQATPKIKIFRLRHGRQDYEFKPGQWIDLFVPIEGKNIGGYTIISSARSQGAIDLAVRQSQHHPVTKFLHEASVGTEIQITMGQGKFFLSDEVSKSESLTFLAGGIGLTPILSMLRSLDLKKTKVKLFYSVSKEEDILFEEELSPFTVFTVTKENVTRFKNERLSLNFLKSHQVDFSSHFFICGPKTMIDSLNAQLISAAVPKEKIYFEKWW